MYFILKGQLLLTSLSWHVASPVPLTVQAAVVAILDVFQLLLQKVKSSQGTSHYFSLTFHNKIRVKIERRDSKL